MDASQTLHADKIIEELKKNNVTHSVWLPCSNTAAIHRAIIEEPSIHSIPVCREGESMAIAAGLSTTLLTFGALNLFFLQTTGLFLISLPQFAVMLVLGLGSSWFGAVLAINYLNLN